MASWPATLPAPLINGYGVNPIDMVARTTMEAGNTKSRRRSLARRDIVPVSWKMTDAEMAIFRTWFDEPTEADGGAGWFDVSLLLGNGGSQTVEARFSGIWQAKMVGAQNWEASASLEVRYA